MTSLYVKGNLEICSIVDDRIKDERNRLGIGNGCARETERRTDNIAGHAVAFTTVV